MRIDTYIYYSDLKLLSMITSEVNELEATPVVFLPKRKKLKKALVDFREKYRVFEILANRYVIGIIAVSGVPFQPMVESVWPAVVTLFIIGPLLQWFMMIDMPAYYEIKNEKLHFHNFEQQNTVLQNSANVTKMFALPRSVVTASFREIRSLEIVRSRVDNGRRLRVKTKDWTHSFDYHLTGKTHRAFEQYLDEKGVSFDTQEF